MKKSLLLQLTEDEHRQLKTLAASHQQTMKSFILSRTLMPNRETLDAFEELEKNRDTLKRYQTVDALMEDVG